MKTSEIIAKIEAFAPLSLSHDFVKATGGYDNSGLLIGGEEIEHDKMLVCMDIEKKDIEYAVENGIKFIFSHHPYIYGKIGDININSPKGREILSIIKNDITVYSAHLNLDVAEGGIDDVVSRLVCGKDCDRKVFCTVDGGGYGKLATLEEERHYADIVNMVNDMFNIKDVIIKKEKINKIATFCGSGLSEDEFYWGIENGADTFISSDVRHHIKVEASRYNVNLLEVPHGYSEFKAMRQCVKKMKFDGLKLHFQSGRIGIK